MTVVFMKGRVLYKSLGSIDVLEIRRTLPRNFPMANTSASRNTSDTRNRGKGRKSKPSGGAGYCLLPTGRGSCATETSENTAVSDAFASCEQTASPTKTGFPNCTCVWPSSRKAAPSLPIHTATALPWRTSFSLNFPGPSNGKSIRW